jgi:hypothetical protein
VNEPEYIDPSKIRPGPIRHESLSPELLEQIKGVFDVMKPYFGMTLEQFEVGFMRDIDPEREVAIWCSITAAWLAYHEKYVKGEALPDEQERTILDALIVISSGVDDVAKLNVPKKVGHRLIQCYGDLKAR